MNPIAFAVSLIGIGLVLIGAALQVIESGVFSGLPIIGFPVILILGNVGALIALFGAYGMCVEIGELVDKQ